MAHEHEKNKSPVVALRGEVQQGCVAVATEAVTIRELIDRMARTGPQAPFLISPETGGQLTFLRLQEQSILLSSQLLAAGLEPGDKIAFLLDNGLFTAQLFLGVIYGGFVAVPLNVGAGVSQLSYTLDHSDAKVVYAEEKYLSLIEEVMTSVRRTVRVIPADVDGHATACEMPIIPAELKVIGPEDPALLMYTSGSTGQPKAAVHSHRTILAHGRNSISSYQLSPADRSLLVLPLYHINAECVTLVPTLMSGGSVVVPHRFSVSQFWDWLDEYHCTWSALVPTIISQLLDWRDARVDSRGAAFERIRFLRSSSAPLAPSLQREFLAKFPLLLVQAMGSSEAGNVFSNPLPPGENKIGTPGLPWGFEAKIVDREGVELPPGESGEVVIRGAAVMQGYYKQPEETASVLDTDGWFHTGDLAYRDEDGYFFVVGRSKELIIKGGVNIAPRQVDDVLESHPAVLEAAAVGVPDHYLGEDVVAFVVLRSGVACDERELLSFCEGRLGHFKTPTRIYFASDLPKGPSGKVQRLRLRDEAAPVAIAQRVSSGGEREIAHGDSHVYNELPLPSSSIQQIIAQSWAEVLSQTHVDADSNFFELGGQSLLAMQCISLLRGRIPVAMSLSDFFENATVAQQAALVRRRLQSDGWKEGQTPKDRSAETIDESLQHKVVLIPLRDSELPCPLSDAQQRLWFLEQLNPESPLYNESEAVRLLGDLNIGAMERALNVIVARHEALRTTIRVTDNEPVMVVHETWPLRVKRIDLSTVDPADRQAEVERLLIDEPRRLYHLETETGIRTTLLRLAPGEHVFILMMHHVISDRSSFGILWREMAALYRAFCRGESFALPTSPIQYGDYVAWQRQHHAGAASAEDLSFWTENLRGAPQLLELPTDRPRPLTLSYRGVKQRFRFDPILSMVLRAFSQREQTSLFTLFTAALNALFYRYTGQEDILLGIPVADRERPELQSVIGFLVDTCVLRTGLAGDMTFRELLARVQRGMRELYRHRAVPFDRVVRELQPERNLGYAPLFQVAMNWRDRGLQLSFIGLEGLVVEPLLAQSRTSKLDLQLFVTDAGDEIWLEIESNTDLFDETRVARMVGHYRILLESVASDPGQRLDALPLLSDAERQQLVVDWNDTRAEYPRDVPLAQLVEEQVERTPDAVAVMFEDASCLTYRGLNERANQLANELRKHGAGPDQLVGMCLERSVDMIVALLAVIKAGAAYAPLDPNIPAARLAYMIEDSGLKILLTQRGLRSSLPPLVGTIIELDAGEWQANRRENLSVPVTPENLAYVIYTSGSTGRPKGVEISRGALINFLWCMLRWLQLKSSDTLLAVTTISFDIAGLEVWLPLLVGACSVIASQPSAADGQRLREMIERWHVSFLQATPVTWQLLLAAGWRGKPDLKAVCGGEAMPGELAAQLRPLTGRFWNLYGPTETTIWSTGWLVEEGDGSVLIGRPLANTQCYILDEGRQPVPTGVIGELYIGGDGLACGYRNQPELTEEKFVQNLFVPGKRMYRTGDLARCRADGNIECLGRADHQVKIRGYRIELGEIEAILRQHPAVRQAIVVARQDAPGEKQLAAYIVVNPECQMGVFEAESHAEHIHGWRTMWDETYGHVVELSDPTFDIALWKSSYSGDAIPPEEMRTWIDTTVQRILALRPKRVWEIGCGTGLVLYRVAPQCAHYRATDFSIRAVEALKQQISGSALADKVLLRQASADDFTGIETESFDAVIINSVVQYFPHISYLVRVLEGAVRAVTPEGAIFLGDIRSEPLLKAFHTAVQLHQALPSLPCAELRRKILRALAQESELTVSPAFFSALRKHLPAVTQVEIQLKRGYDRNELTLFRYDAILRVGATKTIKRDCSRFDWKERRLTMSDLRRYLADERPIALLLTDVPNGRLAQERKALEILEGVCCPQTTGELREMLLGDRSLNETDPEEFWALGEALGYAVQVRWSDGDRIDSCDAVFVRQTEDSTEYHSLFDSVDSTGPAKSWSEYANSPVHDASSGGLMQGLSSHLRELLPHYMVPSAFVALGALPLTPNGKLDRRALPPPVAKTMAGASAPDLMPLNEIEKKIATIWRDVLGATSVGRDDNFFDSGGDSFRLVRVHTHLQRTFCKDIALVDMFRCTTVRTLAQYVSGLSDSSVSVQAQGEVRNVRRHRQLRRHRANASLKESS